jgi:hypothetical protein
MAKELTAIRISGELIDGLKRIIDNASSDSVYRDRSVNWMIGRAVEEFIAAHDAPASKDAPTNKKGKRTNVAQPAQRKDEDPQRGF